MTTSKLLGKCAVVAAAAAAVCLLASAHTIGNHCVWHMDGNKQAARPLHSLVSHKAALRHNTPTVYELATDAAIAAVFFSQEVSC